MFRRGTQSPYGTYRMFGCRSRRVSHLVIFSFTMARAAMESYCAEANYVGSMVNPGNVLNPSEKRSSSRATRTRTSRSEDSNIRLSQCYQWSKIDAATEMIT